MISIDAQNLARALWQGAKKLYAAANVEAGVAESSRRLARLGEKKVRNG